MKHAAIALLLLPLLTSGIRAADQPAFPAKPARAFVESYCLSCHDSAQKKGGFDLDKLATDVTDPGAFAAWVKVFDRVKSGEMPPKSVKTRPERAEADALLKGLEAALAAAERKRVEVAGRAVIRRLNRTEYENTLRDLLDLPGLNVRDLLPDDGRAFGYDKSGAGLDVSSVQLAKYLEAADVALDRAVAKWAVPPELTRARMYPNEQYDFSILLSNGDAVFLKDKKFDPRVPLVEDKWHSHGEMHRAGLFKVPSSVGVFRHQDDAFPARFSRFAPVHPGRYRVRFSVWSYWWEKGEVKAAPRTGAVGLYYGSRLLGHYDAPSLTPTVHDLDLWLEPGEHLCLNPASLWPTRVSELKGRNAGYVGPGIGIDWLDVEGPLHDEWPPASHKRLFGDIPLTPFAKLDETTPRPKREHPRQTKPDGHNSTGRLVFATVAPSDPAARAEKLLKDFLPRAFRRPVPNEELHRYTALVLQRVAAKASFEDAMREAYRVALCSPEFLYLREPAGQLDDHAVASRLSYFLWNSMPDDELFALAAKGLLKEPAVLRAQASRMLADPKAARFVADFLDQWLDLREIDLTTPDRTLYPEFGPYLRDAMLTEPRAFFAEMLRRDSPAGFVVHSDFVMMNQRLAEHYRMPAVSGPKFRPVGVPADSHRGGLLTQAAILKVTANGTTTSPVKRGAWVQRKIVGRPPEPPPPDIPAVEPDVRGTTTVRELLAKHRDQPVCASCHSRIDPPGFALESFDVIGGWRDRFRATAGKDMPDLKAYLAHLGPDGEFPKHHHIGYRLGPPVDANGETADGRKFAGIDEFKKYLLADERQVARNLVGQLVTYATGAPPNFADRAAVEDVLNRTAGNRHGVRSIILEVVQSPMFRQK
jgi:mono/diheme cytochrome c family protein